MTAALFPAPPPARARGRALALYRCHQCRTPIDRPFTWTQPPLFAHGGFGAATRITHRRCQCGTTTTLTLEATNPRPYR